MHVHLQPRHYARVVELVHARHLSRLARRYDEFGPRNKCSPSPKRIEEIILILEIDKDKDKY